MVVYIIGGFCIYHGQAVLRGIDIGGGALISVFHFQVSGAKGGLEKLKKIFLGRGHILMRNCM